MNKSNIKLGEKFEVFNNTINDWDWFTSIEDQEEPLPKEYYDALLELNINKDEAIVCLSQTVGDWQSILSTATHAELKYAIVIEEFGEAIVFSYNN